MLDKRDDGTIELFDYNPTKWSHITDIYQITDPNQAEQIFNELLNDQDFIERDKNHNLGWRSGALNHYILFLRVRKYFSKNVTKTKTIIANLLINKFLPYLTALRTKPFMLLAGISGTGKSRIVRELAKARQQRAYWLCKPHQWREICGWSVPAFSGQSHQRPRYALFPLLG